MRSVISSVRHFQFLLIALGFLISTQSQASVQDRISQPDSAILKRYSIEEMDSAALLLRVTADLEDNQKPRICRKIDPAAAKQLLLPMHSLFDEKVALERKKLPLKGRRLAKARNCESLCHCGAYGTLLENFAQQEKLRESFDKKAATQTSEQSLACAKKSRWFCDSPLLDYLRSELRNYQTN
jgi:hypothetical protein